MTASTSSGKGTRAGNTKRCGKMKIRAFNTKEKCFVGWMGFTDTLEEMEERIKDYNPPEHVIIVESQNDDTKAIMRDFIEQGDRYMFDFNRCKGPDWQQYDTDQDAWYFGVWVNLKERKVVTYCEGDVDITFLLSDAAMKQQLQDMEKFYGNPQPAWTVYDIENNTKTEIYDKRPTMR